MLRKLTKPAVIYRAYRINLNKNRKIKKFARAIEYGAMGTLAAMQTGHLLRQPVVEQFVRTTTAKPDLIITQLPKGEKMGPMPYVVPHFTNFRDSLFRLWPQANQTYNYVLSPELQKTRMLQKQVVLRIMEEDKSIPKNLNKNKLASTIMNVANELEADPITLACIIKKETHFQSGLEYKGAKGLMQITNITVKDMYQKGRDKLYHGALNDLKKDHPTYASLYNVLQNQDSLNIKVGSIVYMKHLKATGGNIPQALQKYNSSSAKESYASEVFRNIQKYSAEFEKLKKAEKSSNNAV